MATVISVEDRRQTPPERLKDAPRGAFELSPIPDLASWPQLFLATAAVWAIAALTGILSSASHLGRTIGDTDDAMRLTMVRDLAAGRGWFDQKLTRLQPPEGLFMHWSRLVDGAEAGLLKLFGLVLPADQAETAMRLAWPLLWIPPVTLAVLLIARRLGGGRAVFLGAVAVSIALLGSGEFLPGRVDHHSAQIACCLMALAAAAQRPSIAWALTCGGVSALGLAIGLEALPFIAVVGVAMGGVWAFGQSSGRVLASYGLTLAISVLGLYALQTPPERWMLPVCDAMASNLVAGLGVAGVGLALVAGLGAKGGRWTRLALLASVGAMAGAAYAAIDPLCLRGPMAAVDPVVRFNWLIRVSEVTPWPAMLKQDPALAINIAAPSLIGAASWLWLGRRPEMRRNSAWMLLGALLLTAATIGFGAIRFGQYAAWFAAPLAAAALVEVAEVALAGRMLPAVAILVVGTLAPGYAAAFTAEAIGDRAAKAVTAKSDAAAERCTATNAFRPLAKLPPGLVLAETDAGPYILANTADSVVQAPYHRLSWGMTSAWAALGAPAALAEDRVRALKVTYVVDCPAHASRYDHRRLSAASLQKVLDQGRSPAWLQPLSLPGEPLQIYRVR